MMECLRAQEQISDALDRLEVDAAELESAKEHCRTCHECGAFVRGQLAMRRAPLPAPAGDFADRVMARVRAEITAEPIAAATAVGTRPSESHAEKPAPARTWNQLFARATAPRNRRALAAWSAAAAVLFIAAGIGAWSGVRTILVPRETSEAALTSDLGEFGRDEPSAATEERQADGGIAAATDARFITVGADVYRFTALTTDVEKSDLVQVGETRSALDTGGASRTVDILGTEGTARVYLASDSGLLAFDPVTRTHAGVIYILQSNPIGGFGEWPTLPSTLKAPTSADGSPTFKEAEADSTEAAVFVLKGGTAADGIALPPSTTPGDPLAGSPDWSWWIPQR